MNGLLRDHPLVELIREISAERLSGALRLTRERVKVVIHFDSGALVSARSNLRAHRLAESLKRWNTFERGRLDALLTESMTDAEAGAALVAGGVLGHEELDKLRARQSADALRPPLLWIDGEWDFDPRSRADGHAHAPLETAQLLIEAARRLPANFVAGRMADGAETISPAVAASAGAQLQPAEGFVLSRVEAPLSAGDLVAISGVAENEALRIAYALALGGFLARAEWPRALSPEAVAGASRAASPAPGSKAATPRPQEQSGEDVHGDTPPDAAKDPRAELNELFARADAGTHYEVLDVSRLAQPSEIKRSYHALAKRFHPDRFHRGADAASRARVEQAFTKILEAHEVLMNAGARAAYDLKLDAGATQGVAGGAGANSANRNEGGGADHLDARRRAEENFQRGLAALRQGDQMRAAEHLGEAARSEPNQPRYRAHYGQALSTTPATRRRAEAEFQAAIALDARNAGYRVMLAELYRGLGLQRKAVAELERALAVDARHADARRLLDELRKGVSGEW